MSPTRKQAWVMVAIGWLIVAGITIAEASRRVGPNALTHLYHEAGRHWHEGLPLYQGPVGFNYLPHFAATWSFAVPYPRYVVELGWRLGSLSAFVFALVWLVHSLAFRGPKTRPRLSLEILALLLPVPSAISAVQSGQANLLLAALLAAWGVALARQQPVTTIVFAFAALAVKPLAIVALAVTYVSSPRTRSLVVLGLPAFVAAPFLFQRPDYVIEQYSACWVNLGDCARVTENRFCDLHGLLERVGWVIPRSERPMLAALAGVTLLGVVWLERNLPIRYRTAWAPYAWAISFLMLFNPMNETNSFVLLGPVLICLALTRTSRQSPNATLPVPTWCLVLAALILGCDNFGRSLHDYTNLWLKPLLAGVVMVWLTSRIAVAWIATLTIMRHSLRLVPRRSWRLLQGWLWPSQESI